MKLIPIALLAISLVPSLNASVIGMDIFQVLVAPGAANAFVLERSFIGIPDNGTLLDATHMTSNPGGLIGMLEVKFDSNTNILSLIPNADDTYEEIYFGFFFYHDNDDVMLDLTPILENAATGDFFTDGILEDDGFLLIYSAVCGCVPPATIDLHRGEMDRYQLTFGPDPIPEPGSFVLLASGAAALWLRSRRRTPACNPEGSENGPPNRAS